MNLLKEKEVLDELRISRMTLWRWKQKGMPVKQLSSRITRYELDKILEWLDMEG